MCLKEPSHVCLIKRALPTTRFVSREYQKKERERDLTERWRLISKVGFLSFSFTQFPFSSTLWKRPTRDRSVGLPFTGRNLLLLLRFFFLFGTLSLLRSNPLSQVYQQKKNELSLFFAPRPFFFFSEGKFEINKHKFP